MDFKLDGSWRKALADELASGWFAELSAFVSGEYSSGRCYPPEELVFEAFNRTPFEKTKVVIIGQDPYHGPGQAHGLCFSVPAGIPAPPSLANIRKELELEYGRPPASPDGDLSAWAEQGVLLLNATLTVAEHKPLSHTGRGWEKFTDAAVRALSEKREGLVFMLWGANAAKKARGVDRTRHLALEAPHPSPLSAYRGFFGCGHFKKANEYLVSRGEKPIDWIGR